jgi:glycerate kinase
VCCDVRTSFVSAAHLFGPQKGASRKMVRDLQQRLTDLSGRYLSEFYVDVSAHARTGAAGGLAGGLMVLGATLTQGFDLIADAFHFDDALEEADLVVTGEGQFDHSSYDGKVVGGVIARARRRHVPVIVLAGSQVISDPTDPEVTVLSLVDRCGRDAAFADPVRCVRQILNEYLLTHRIP